MNIENKLVQAGVSIAIKYPKVLTMIGKYVAWRHDRIRKNHKCLWRVQRDGGGGKLITPKPMTEQRAVAWVTRVTGGEVFHVDFEYRMIFYRSAGVQRLAD